MRKLSNALQSCGDGQFALRGVVAQVAGHHCGPCLKARKAGDISSCMQGAAARCVAVCALESGCWCCQMCGRVRFAAWVLALLEGPAECGWQCVALQTCVKSASSASMMRHSLLNARDVETTLRRSSPLRVVDNGPTRVGVRRPWTWNGALTDQNQLKNQYTVSVSSPFQF